jgi:hypothetical protein
MSEADALTSLPFLEPSMKVYYLQPLKTTSNPLLRTPEKAGVYRTALVVNRSKELK